jgi:radical SAM superfamily enzyme YgiQ (UPF0313 family)
MAAGTWSLLSQARRRLSGEEGTLFKQAKLKVALCSPSTYHVGMSSLGFQTIYREIHLHPAATAERAFFPDDPATHRKQRFPLFTLESEIPLSDFPVVAFSISYELEIAGLLEVMELGGIPLKREDRTRQHPLVLVGGPLTNSNPMPLAPFADLIILGEGEEQVYTFLDAAVQMERADLLAMFSQLPGCYVPGQTTNPAHLSKASDDRLPARSQILTRDTVLASMFLLEPERGCSRGCTYCVMRRTTNGGMRTVAPEKVLSFVPDNARRVGLVGAAVTDHPRIREVVRSIVDSGREIGISSLRADRLDEELVSLLARGGYRTLTTASDGVSQRIRDQVNRRTSESHLIRAAELARKFKLQRLKLYQMLGLPGETDSDVDELVRFSKELVRIIPLSLTLSPFVAKRNTPLDGAAFEPIPALEAKLTRLRSGLRGLVDLRPTSTRWAWVEYMLSQGTEAAGLAALNAWRAGGSFSAWKRAFEKLEIDPAAKQGVRSAEKS